MKDLWFLAQTMIFLPTPRALNNALCILASGGLIGLPTETVYGLAADASQDLAVAKIFEEKKRPTFNPLIIHGSSAEPFKEHVLWNQKAETLAKAFWPGPLTLVLASPSLVFTLAVCKCRA